MLAARKRLQGEIKPAPWTVGVDGCAGSRPGGG